MRSNIQWGHGKLFVEMRPNFDFSMSNMLRDGFDGKREASQGGEGIMTLGWSYVSGHFYSYG